MLTLVVLALALAADAFAVALCQGAAARPGAGRAIGIAAAFGAAQVVMPLGGWALGTIFAGAIDAYDHWIAFGLLSFLGIRMAKEGLAPAPAHDPAADPLGPPEPLAGHALLIAAIATSIDAAAAGITLPTLGIPVIAACLTIGGVTAALCYIGVLAGAAIGTRLGKRAEVAGGVVLVLLGVRILGVHSGWW